MRRMIWMMILAAFFTPPMVRAGEWDKLMTDIELFDDVMKEDDQNMNNALFDANMQSHTELFPINDDEEDIAESSQFSDSHVTIKVDGVPVVLNDVPLTQWFAVYVRDVAEKNIVSGYRDVQNRPTGDFGPADNVTIEQLVKMAALSAQIDIYTCGEDMKNTSALGRWSEKYVRCAEYNKWAIFSEGTVESEKAATRTEVVVTVLQAFGARISPRSGSVFEDVTTATPYAAAIETAANKGIVSGYSDENGTPTGMFGPDDLVNRAEIAKIFSLAFQVYGGTN